MSEPLYTRRRHVEVYEHASGLRPGEQAALERIGPSACEGAILDLGVGGGRTTAHFLGRSRFYVGVDLSTEMAAACRRRFAGQQQTPSLVVADAAHVGRLFRPRSFDLALFSFNGIDHLDEESRAACLAGVHSILRPGGHFLYSSHSVERADFAHSRYRFVVSWNPVRMVRRILRWLRSRVEWAWQNRATDFKEVRRRGRGVIREEITAGGFGGFSRMFYVSEAEALREMARAGFELQGVFSDRDGREPGPNRGEDRWFYYLGRRLS